MSVQLAPPAADPFHYPDSDGKPMGETPRHIQNMLYSLYPLQRWFADDDMVFVAANMFVYYVKGNPTKHVSPDIFAARGVPKVKIPEWRKYLVWEHGKGPDAAIEFTSESTREEDLVDKKLLYQNVLKVQEYFLFDPWDEYLVPRLQGLRLIAGLYQPIAPIEGRLPSEVLGLHLEAEGELLRFIDPRTGERLPVPPELDAKRQQAEAAREEAEAARQWEHAARERAEGARLNEEVARQQAEAARQQAEAARRDEVLAREKERAGREEAEAELDRLRRELEELRKHLPPDGAA